MSDLVHRIKTSLEPILDLADPRERISAYHDMPYALFRYEPEEEFELREQIRLLETRLTQKGKSVSRISLAQCLDEAMRFSTTARRLVCRGARAGNRHDRRDRTFGPFGVRAPG